ncbi:MAG: ATP-binding protein [Balneolaceae bacterium]|nr:ATP-binding protein [Balneolaceae bacterium]
MELIEELTLKSTYEELEKVEGFLENLQQELGYDNEFNARLMLTVSESATNGVVHGNKLDETKTVTLKAYLKASKLIIETTDEGAGFNPDEVPDPLTEENLLNPDGRGVFLMDEYADEVNYSEGGSKLTLVFELPE